LTPERRNLTDSETTSTIEASFLTRSILSWLITQLEYHTGVEEQSKPVNLGVPRGLTIPFHSIGTASVRAL
jgi:hypothetical protein